MRRLMKSKTIGQTKNLHLQFARSRKIVVQRAVDSERSFPNWITNASKKWWQRNIEETPEEESSWCGTYQ